MKRFALALFLTLLSFPAWAQCNGVFPNNTVCGNITGTGNLPRPTNPSAFQGSAGGVNGQIQYNNAGALGGFTAGGDATIATPSGTVTIQPGVVTNSKLATMPAHTYKGNNTGSTGSPLDLTTQQVASDLGVPLNPGMFGAVCDGVTNDAVPLQNWLNAIRDGGVGTFTASQTELGCASDTPLLLQASTNVAPVQGPRILGTVHLRGIGTLGGSGNATSVGTSVTFTNLVGSIHVGDTIIGGPIPNNIHILSQTSGTPNGNGVYVTDFAANAVGGITTVTSDLLRIWNPDATTTSQNFYYPVIDGLQLTTGGSTVANCLSLRGFWGSIAKVLSREGCHGGDLVQLPNWIGPGAIPDEYESQGSIGDLTCINCSGYVYNNLIGIGASVRAGNVRGTVSALPGSTTGGIRATGGENFNGAIAFTGSGWAVTLSAPPAGGGAIVTVPHEMFFQGAGDIDCIENGVWVAAGDFVRYVGHRLNIEGANTLCGNPFPQWPLTAYKFGGGSQRLIGVTVEPYITIRPGVNLAAMTAFMDFSNDANIANLIVNATVSDQTGTFAGTAFSTLYKNINANATIRIIINGQVIYDNISSVPFASLPTCQIGLNGGPLFNVTDSNTATWGAAIAGGGANRVKAACLGTTWVVN